jgi:hypothetical protein
MSRLGTGDVIAVKPTNNVYTALAAAAFVVVTTGLVLFYIKAEEVLGAGVLLQQ